LYGRCHFNRELYTFVCGPFWPAQDGCQVEYIVFAGGFEAGDGGRGIFVVLV
jgi:hypothetical protein